MNKGTWKGGAKGFRLVSLARLSHTKSTDGKSTIMNYLVQLLHTRHETNSDTGAFAALQLDEELGSIRLAKNISVPGAALRRCLSYLVCVHRVINVTFF